jgi:hypothetical protein
MKQMLKRLPKYYFTVVIFGDEYVGCMPAYLLPDSQHVCLSVCLLPPTDVSLRCVKQRQGIRDGCQWPLTKTRTPFLRTHARKHARPTRTLSLDAGH